jgi:hypothetical protein
MNRYLAAVALLVIVLPTGFSRAADEQDPAAVLPKMAAEKRDAARKTYEVLWANYREGTGSEELVYRWSKRWLRAERELSSRQGDQVVACQAHVKRMQDLERLIRRVQGAGPGLTTIDEVSAAAYYRVEAEMWLLEARQEKKKP